MVLLQIEPQRWMQHRVTIEGFKSYKKQVTIKDFSLKVNCGGMIFFHVLCRGVNEPSRASLGSSSGSKKNEPARNSLN
ncbi:hypothetical protein Hanom_Chr07g00681011 [Helianthus anomalus]